MTIRDATRFFVDGERRPMDTCHMTTPQTEAQTVALLTASLARLTHHCDVCGDAVTGDNVCPSHPNALIQSVVSHTPSLKVQLWHAKAALKQAKKEAKAALRTGTPTDLTRTVNAMIEAQDRVEQLKALVEAQS